MNLKNKLNQLVRAESPRHRVMLTFLSNIAKSGFGFLTAILIARELGPGKYGEYGFLITSFSSIVFLIDVGSANAFYSHISRRARGRAFYLIYMVWMAIQFVLASLFLVVLIPSDFLKILLLSDDRLTIFMAFCAVFGQQQCINALTMILESDRKTFRSQTVLLFSSIYYLVVIGIYSLLAPLSLNGAFAIMVSQQLLAGLMLYRSARQIISRSNDIAENWRKCFGEYTRYCTPMIPSVIFSFVYNYSDRWLLQKFSGSIEQGYFQIATQLSLVTMIFTASLLRVFSKESASAMASGDNDRLGKIYRDAYLSTIIIISFMTGMVVPWTSEILRIALGVKYVGAANILLILLVYPIYQSLGQIAGTFLMSIGETALHSVISIALIVVSLPLGFLLLAPSNLHGFDLGGLGLALKLFFVSFFSVNILNYAIARRKRFKLDFMSQAVIPLFLGAGFFAKYLMTRLVNIDINSIASVALSACVTSLLYVMFVYIFVSLLRKDGISSLLSGLFQHK